MPVIAIEDYDVLSTLTFKDNSTFSAEAAAVIAMVASDAADEYSILSLQCDCALEDDKRMGRPERVKTVNDSASSIPIPSSDTSKQSAQPYLAREKEEPM
ncbi:uncharacterized protein ARMOST_16471 [Armillaria ostoyae]|uniref:Uncharacterized protein n=1 Tax=Armillaria ostoyae TaxID=47428 RepID=A0A284RWC0_ARMOS|nr:uncharacterized protein ARMOST_16471 [Armillaria ostoyae]